MLNRKKVLLIVDFQKAFESANAKYSTPFITHLATKHKWDTIVQTLWFNSKNAESLYLVNLDYKECDPHDRKSGLVKRFKDSILLTRYDKYSCMCDELAMQLYGNTEIYIAGWETDACILGTCFELFDRSIRFKVVTDCVSTSDPALQESALKVMRRNFGEDSLIRSDDIKF